MNFVFLMDPLETVVMQKDTTFILMVGAHRKGHKVYFLPKGGIVRRNDQFIFHTIEVEPQKDAKIPFMLKGPVLLNDSEVDCVFIRPDPPFDEEYLYHTWILEQLPKRIAVINNPAGIRSANEKLWAMQFTNLIPPTFVGRIREGLLSFINEQKSVIAKPMNGFGGRGVFRIDDGDTNTNVILESLTDHGKVDIIVQKYIKDSTKGDKRILLLNGDPIGAVLRVHAEHDHRNNFLSGGKPVATEITKRDQDVINILKPKLQALGLYFVGIDMLGDYLIEVNVTSPTCLQEVNALYNLQQEDQVINFAEKLIDQSKSNTKILT